MFCSEPRTKIGLQAQCKLCQKELRAEKKEQTSENYKKYYAKNSDRLKAYQKKYAEENPEKLRARKATYYKKVKDTVYKEYVDKNASRIKEKAREYRKENREKIREYMKHYLAKYIEQNREELLQKKREYFKKNKDQLAEKAKLYKKRNRAYFNAKNSERRASILQRTLHWLSSEDKHQISLFYKAAKFLESVYNVEYHVDHIIPLLGEDVCGLHVPWNLQLLTSTENLSKGNRYNPEDAIAIN